MGRLLSRVFITDSHTHASLYAGKLEPTQVEPLREFQSMGRLQAFSKNIKVW
jgi:predicted amidohydrolase YtcJ